MIEQKLSEKYENQEKDSKELIIDGVNCKCCPIFNTFNIIGKKFTPLLIRNMIFLKHKRFSEFLNSIEEINPKTLSIRLKEMEREGLIRREVYNETPIRIEYYLTEKGKGLQPILEQMALFSMKYCCGQVFKNPDSLKIDKINIKSIKKYNLL